MELNLRLESDDEAEQTPEEKLYIFLHKSKAHHRAPELFEVFNAEFPLQGILNASEAVLADRQQEYEERVGGNNSVILHGERYVHVSDFTGDKAAKRRLNRSLEKLPSFAIRVEEKCPVHSKKCRLLQSSYGFVCFLHLLTEDSEPQVAELPSTIAPLEEEGLDEEIAIDPAEERALLPVAPLEEEGLDEEIAIDPASSSSMVPREGIQEGDLPLPCFPSFPIVGQMDYVLLIDIMHYFNMREDYCLAAISNFSEADMDWVEEGVDKHLLMDSAVQDGQYQQGMDILKSLFDEARSYEANLPSNEEAAVAAERLGLAEMGKFPAPVTQADSKSTIPLWTGSLLEADENQQVQSSSSFS